MPLTFDQSVARRVRYLRERHSWSQQDLATKLANFGMPIDRSAVARLENGKRAVSLEEAMRLAFALNVAPVHLFVDPDGDEPITPTPGAELSPEEARAWIRGDMAMPWQDRRFYFSAIPDAEFEGRGGVPPAPMYRVHGPRPGSTEATAAEEQEEQ
jgi:transcriptional regulator with XRE-family HTH domain